MIASQGSVSRILTDTDVRSLVAETFSKKDVRGERVLVIVPDHTRTAPLGLFFRAIHDEIGGRTKKLDFLIALGTHPAIDAERIDRLFGFEPGERERRYPGTRVFNHRWDDPDALQHVGTIGADELEEISSGLLREQVPVEVNRLVFEYDLLVICGPTFPHEVVGFSGGNKYFFPGIAGPEVLNLFHWLGALITNPVIIGTKDTPVRKVIDRAAALIPRDKLCMSMVVTHEGLNGLYVGSPEQAWSHAADLSAKLHIVYKDHAFRQALSMAPEMYDDIWTAAKAMYKLEPVIADGGEIIVYAPHVTEVSYMHGKLLDNVGYHVRDYFVKQWERFRHVPRCVLAHATHVKGIGTYENGAEKPRIRVVFATGIPEERCRRINQGYRDPRTIDPEDYADREDEGILLVRKAGEMLYKLKDGTAPGLSSSRPCHKKTPPGPRKPGRRG
ncbi:MAG: lactate racemase domain-containing protein [Planctomycetota bacterium]